MTIFCPNCNTRLSFPDEYRGREVKCLKCNKQFCLDESASRPAPPNQSNEHPIAANKPGKVKKGSPHFGKLPEVVVIILLVVVLLQSAIMNRRLKRIEADVWSVPLTEGNLSSIEEKVSSIEEKVSSIESDISSMKSNVWSIESDVSSIKSDVSSIKSDVSSIKSDVSSIETEVDSIALKLLYQ